MISCQNIQKYYGKKAALVDLSLELSRGEFYGLIGPNGCGKTTLMKLLVGLHRENSGEYRLKGESFRSKMKESISFMPAEDIYYPWLTIKDIIALYKGNYATFNPDYLHHFCEERNISPKQKISELSTGERAILRVFSTLARDVEIYIFDEPLNGIDLIARETILAKIASHLNENRLILATSHIIYELEKAITHTIFLKAGKIVLDTPMNDLTNKTTGEKGDLNTIYREYYDV